MKHKACLCVFQRVQPLLAAGNSSTYHKRMHYIPKPAISEYKGNLFALPSEKEDNEVN
ncbi:MAG: hypothetical protein IKL19_00010 [Paludibacteraceae bacterium]|nr:hypothetical protein [Paludibacteraceae bacterium]